MQSSSALGNKKAEVSEVKVEVKVEVNSLRSWKL